MGTDRPVRQVVHLDIENTTEVASGVKIQNQITAIDESPLTLDAIFFEPGASLEISGADRDLIIYVQKGSVTSTLNTDDQVKSLASGGAIHLDEDMVATLVAGEEGAQLFSFATERTADWHAALGDFEAYNQTDFSDLEDATSNRSFQILFGPQNGSLFATFFVGIVPPGAAPWHYHTYDEIVVLSKGEMTFHQPTLSVPGQIGTAFRIVSRDMHVNENTSATEDTIELGIFTPAGNPSHAFLPYSAEK